MRVALTEPLWRRIVDSELVAFARNYKVFIYKRGTEELATIWSEEESGEEVEQPLVTDDGGRPKGEDDVLGWIAAGRYDILVNGIRIPWEAAAGGSGGGGGGGAVDSVAGRTGDVVLSTADISGLPFVSVKAFGAKGDGATDDTAAVEAARAVIAAGGCLFFPRGTYLVTGLTIDSEQWFVGEGLASVIKLKNSANADLIRTKGFTELLGTNEEAGPSQFGIFNLKLDGNNAHNTKGRGLALYGRNFILDVLEIVNTAEDGIFSEWADGGDNMEAICSRVKVVDCDGNGVTWKGPHDSKWSQSHVIRAGAGKIGFQIDGGAAAGIGCADCHIWGDGPAKAWHVNGAGSTLLNCVGEGASEIQCHAQATALQVLGGSYFGGGDGDESTALKVGDEAEGSYPSKCKIDTRLGGSATLVEFDASGGHNTFRFEGQKITAGAVSTGTPHYSDQVDFVTGDSANDIHSIPGKLELVEQEGAEGEPVLGDAGVFVRTVDGKLELCAQFISGGGVHVLARESNVEELASAEALEVNDGVEFVRISGTASIKEIATTRVGHLIVLKFGSTAEVIEGGNLKIDGNFKASENATLTLICGTGNWFEVSRKPAGAGAVSSVNGKTGAVTGLEDTANKVQTLSGESESEYPSEKAVQVALAGKQASLGFTAENAANKDTDSTLAANSDTKYPSQKAIKAYVDGLLAASDAVIYKGAKDCSANPKFPAADAGHLYRVSVAGKIGGGSGVNVEVGDTLLCNADGSAEGTQAEVGSKWNVIQANIDGAVVGPTSSTSGNFPTFEGTTGKVVKDSGVSLDTDNTLAANSDTKIASQKAVKAYARPAATTIHLKVPHSWTVGGVVTAQTLNRIFMAVGSSETVKIVGMRYIIDSGTKCKIKLQKNEADVTGFKEKEVTTEAKEATGEVELSDKDRLRIVVESAEGSPTNLSVTLFVERSF